MQIQGPKITVKTEISFNSGDVLKLRLASGGGWVAHIYPER